MVDADTVFHTRVVVAINSIYYPGVFAAVRRHLESGGVAYVVLHCADHSGHTWGDEASVTVAGDVTMMSTEEDGTGYQHGTWAYSAYSSFNH